jgi:hypothetical protein
MAKRTVQLVSEDGVVIAEWTIHQGIDPGTMESVLEHGLDAKSIAQCWDCSEYFPQVQLEEAGLDLVCPKCKVDREAKKIDDAHGRGRTSVVSDRDVDPGDMGSAH